MIKFNEVTWYSKLAAILFFVGFFPAITFYIGTEYEKTVSYIEKSEMREHATTSVETATTSKAALVTKKAATSTPAVKVIIPAHFSPTGVQQEIDVISYYASRKGVTQEQGSARLKNWFEIMKFMRDTMACTGTDCADVHFPGPCGGRDAKIKKEYVESGVSLYNLVRHSYEVEFHPIYEC